MALAQDTSRAGAYISFWSKYLTKVKVDHPDWTRTSTPPKSNWLWMSAGSPGFGYSVSFSTGARIKHELYIDPSNDEASIAAFESLLARRDAIETAYNAPLEWDFMSGRRACRIAHYQPGMIESTADHDSYVAYFIDAGERMRAALGAYIPEAAEAARITKNNVDLEGNENDT